MSNQGERLTAMQRYYISLIWSFRIFGLVFAILSVVIAASNLLSLPSERTGSNATLAVITVIFVVVGCGIYLGSTRLLRWYKQSLTSR
jgi:uncharacterized BrkB/YihY/UPF0761 family membrane protein